MFGAGGISIWQLLIVLVIVVMIFGTKKLRGLGGDLGSAVKGFKSAVKDESKEAADAAAEEQEKLEEAADGVTTKARSTAEDKV